MGLCRCGQWRTDSDIGDGSPLLRLWRGGAGRIASYLRTVDDDRGSLVFGVAERPPAGLTDHIRLHQNVSRRWDILHIVCFLAVVFELALIYVGVQVLGVRNITDGKALRPTDGVGGRSAVFEHISQAPFSHHAPKTETLSIPPSEVCAPPAGLSFGCPRSSPTSIRCCSWDVRSA